MNEYVPDVWARIRITNADGKQHDRILAGWTGSFTSGASWKINSGITKVTRSGNFWIVEGFTGSIYRCYVESEGLNLYTSSVLAYQQENMKAVGATIEVVKMEDEYNKVEQLV